jgi:hypothetical protein
MHYSHLTSILALAAIASTHSAPSVGSAGRTKPKVHQLGAVKERNTSRDASSIVGKCFHRGRGCAAAAAEKLATVEIAVVNMLRNNWNLLGENFCMPGPPFHLQGVVKQSLKLMILFFPMATTTSIDRVIEVRIAIRALSVLAYKYPVTISISGVVSGLWVY